MPTRPASHLLILTINKDSCNSRGFQGGDYEERRLLGYIIPSSYLTGDTLRLHYRDQPVNALLRFEVFTVVTKKNAVFWVCKI
jgi:hypothetical protein